MSDRVLSPHPAETFDPAGPRRPAPLVGERTVARLMAPLNDSVVAMAVGVLIGATFVEQLGEVVTFFVSLGGAGGVIGRFIADWRVREGRRPEFLTNLNDREQAAVAQRRASALWLGTIAGVAFGLAVALLAFAVDAL